MKRLYVSLLLLLTSYCSHAQALYKVEIEEKISNSTLIVEGKVISQQPFWNSEHRMIYTSNEIKLTKIFKGTAQSSTIEIITQGGTIDNQSIQVSELLDLQKDETGVFFCYPNSLSLRSPKTNNILFDVYSSSQGFFNYDVATGSASAPFVRYKSIVTGLYPELESKIGHGYTVVDASFKLQNRQNYHRTTAPVINNFSPATVNAGAILDPASNLLTITGSGFGTPTGSAAILFDDANNGTGGTAWTEAATSSLVVSWTDNQIQIRVPSRVGSGAFQVRDPSGITGGSPADLKVFYSILNYTSSGIVKEPNLMNFNGSGGYTLNYNNDLYISPTLATFQRALTTWKENVGVNFSEAVAPTFATSITDATFNIAEFDNAGTGVAALSSGVLAVCYSFYGDCSIGSAAQKVGFDIIIRSAYSSGSANFTSGPCGPNTTQTDLETVILHELGHALNLGHINDSYEGFSAGFLNPGKLMNYAIINSVKRTSPDASALQGGLYAAAPQGNAYGSCGLATTEMTQLSYTSVTNDECPAVFPSTPTPGGTSVPFDLVHATSNYSVDPAYNNFNCSGAAGVTNTQYYALKTNYSGQLNLAVNSYVTTPVTSLTCNEGVELSLFSVSSCPGGQSFPGPYACRTFNADGSLTAITGLNANTTYLLMADGINNTKATFNLVLTGTVFPVKLTSFTGKVMDGYNLLNWEIETISGINRINIEKSGNGISFEAIGTATLDKKNSFKDIYPFIGNNYYRLAFKGLDGSIEYSPVIVLKRNDKVLVSLSPNPARSNLVLQISSAVATGFNLSLYSLNGQKVLNRNFAKAAGTFTETINIGSLPKAIYRAVVYTNEGEPITSQTLIIQ